MSNRRWLVVRDYYNDAGDNMQSPHPILFGSEREAENLKAQLEAGCDPSFFDPSDDDAGFLFVDEFDLSGGF